MVLQAGASLLALGVRPIFAQAPLLRWVERALASK
jgi:hypothetical protein